MSHRPRSGRMTCGSIDHASRTSTHDDGTGATPWARTAGATTNQAATEPETKRNARRTSSANGVITSYYVSALVRLAFEPTSAYPSTQEFACLWSASEIGRN